MSARLAQGITAHLYQARGVQHSLTFIEIINHRTDYRTSTRAVRNHQDAATPIHIHRYPAREQCLHQRGYHHRHRLPRLFSEQLRLMGSQT